MSTSILTPKFRASYVNVFKPRKVRETDSPKYSISACFEKDPECPKGSSTIKDLQAAALAAAYEEFGDTDKTRKAIKAGSIKMPFITGDKLENDIEEGKVPEGTICVMRFNSPETSKPGVVDRFRGPDGKAMPITSEEIFYSGCYARAEVRAFAYNYPESKGVAFALNNLQKLGDGERLGGGKRPAAEAFADFEFDDTPPEMGGDEPKASDDDANPMGLDI